ncbi:uncharacterized protein BDR25DRAFT_349366 [Lindgomyces ingoldianus]|uniref:Uncharacterized protein n=1 Tax=Lindgomyces ingoldianus TaxID=673940 RepID=A0ACB6RCQ8_9PLEO|nr:uncharacterized protein BDR25DRAFT_349366 [Lindgomyces ingoldianus]KAF2476256.1 hypothetical protein BDR25DRAFT_349366 [Lindgomyces ingoldianus]
MTTSSKQRFEEDADDPEAPHCRHHPVSIKPRASEKWPVKIIHNLANVAAEDASYPEVPYLKHRQDSMPPQPSKNQAARSIQNLPDELLLKIISSIPDGGQPLALYRQLSLVSRSFYRVTATPLWRKYEHRWGKYLTPYICTLMERPDLADLVKEVKSENDWGILERSPQGRNQQEREAIFQNLKELGIPKASMWAKQFENGEDVLDDLELALLLCQTRNLETLRVTIGSRIPSNQGRGTLSFKSYPSYLEPLMYAACGIPYGRVHQFNSLQRLRLNMKTTVMGRVSCLFRLPSLLELDIEDLHIWNLAFIHQPDCNVILEKWNCPPSFSSIVSLRFWNCTIPKETVDRAIRSCKALKIFSFYGSAGNGWYASLTNSLGAHITSLQFVRIQPDIMGSHADQFGPFKDFKQLRYLSASMYLLLGLPAFEKRNDDTKLPDFNDLLPTSLETLALDMPLRLERKIAKWTVLYKALLPIGTSKPEPLHIKHIFVRSRGVKLSAFAKFKQAFAERGVNFDHKVVECRDDDLYTLVDGMDSDDDDDDDDDDSDDDGDGDDGDDESEPDHDYQPDFDESNSTKESDIEEPANEELDNEESNNDEHHEDGHQDDEPHYSRQYSYRQVSSAYELDHVPGPLRYWSDGVRFEVRLASCGGLGTVSIDAQILGAFFMPSLDYITLCKNFSKCACARAAEYSCSRIEPPICTLSLPHFDTPTIDMATNRPPWNYTLRTLPQTIFTKESVFDMGGLFLEAIYAPRGKWEEKARNARSGGGNLLAFRICGPYCEMRLFIITPGPSVLSTIVSLRRMKLTTEYDKNQIKICDERRHYLNFLCNSSKEVTMLHRLTTCGNALNKSTLNLRQILAWLKPSV